MHITITGNLTANPELRYTPSGQAVCSFTIAHNDRYRDGNGEWQDGETSFVRCQAWRELGERVAESAKRGDRVIATGNLQGRSYQDKDQNNRVSWEVTVSEFGMSVRYARVSATRIRLDEAPLPDGPHGTPAPATADTASEEVPF